MHFLLGFVTKQSKKYLFTPDNASIKSDCFYTLQTALQATISIKTVIYSL